MGGLDWSVLFGCQKVRVKGSAVTNVSRMDGER